jgi:hypothetical protein
MGGEYKKGHAIAITNCLVIAGCGHVFERSAYAIIEAA